MGPWEGQRPAGTIRLTPFQAAIPKDSRLFFGNVMPPV